MSAPIDPACDDASPCTFCGKSHAALLQSAESIVAVSVPRERYIVALLDGPNPYRVSNFTQYPSLAEADACIDGVYLLGLDEVLVVIWDRETRRFTSSDTRELHTDEDEDEEYELMLSALLQHLVACGALDPD